MSHAAHLGSVWRLKSPSPEQSSTRHAGENYDATATTSNWLLIKQSATAVCLCMVFNTNVPVSDPLAYCIKSTSRVRHDRVKFTSSCCLAFEHPHNLGSLIEYTELTTIWRKEFLFCIFLFILSWKCWRNYKFHITKCPSMLHIIFNHCPHFWSNVALQLQREMEFTLWWEHIIIFIYILLIWYFPVHEHVNTPWFFTH